ncbi:hypothetical protein GCM10009560_34180 [Nonomuraea longicatena]|uniref:Translation initiation factor IF-2 n=1 Tax=Nonomuraea longicatena TaxID=83682 RepID=A0ABN1PLF4_9ACTN
MDHDRWTTVRARKHVLAVARNLTSAGRLLDVLPVFGSDPRVQTVFTTVSGSAFDDGLLAYLEEIQARVIPWRQAVGTRYDLALSASANGDLHRLDAPLLLMPHGAGHNRLLRTADGYSSEVSGLARSQLMRDGAVVPSAIALSHPDQVDRLARYCPEAAPRAVVTGDPCFDRIVAHLPRRDRYRRALDVPPGGTLVLVSSTWGEHSLLGAGRDLPARLSSELPLDEFRVAVVAHPNVWKKYGGLQVRLWLADARAAGLALIPPEHGWQAALIASDVVVGDHGSVTFYGAALDRPTLLASSGREHEELDPRSPTAELSRSLPRLDRRRDLLKQIGLAVTAHRPGAHAETTGRTLAGLGAAQERLRRLAYRLMELPSPPGPVVQIPLPEPRAERQEVTAFLAQVRFEGDGHAVLRRFPAAARTGAAEPDPHLVVDEEDLDRRLLESASVVIGRDRPAEWLQETLLRYPGAAAPPASVTGDGLVRMSLRGGAGTLLARAPGGGLDPRCLPPVLYGWAAAGRDPAGLLSVGIGPRSFPVSVTHPAG